MTETLDPVKIIGTADKLEKRISERFPERGIADVAKDVCKVTREAAQVVNYLQRPLYWYRLISGTGALILIAVSTIILILVHKSLQSDVQAHEWLQTAEAATNDIIFISIAMFFIVRFERILKRNRALRMLHQLRSLAHIIDMHQLTKDPESVAGNHNRTTSSPDRTLSPYELKRYYDYCSEMLALISKSAAVLVQKFDDPVTLAAVNEIETLSNGLSRKIWQKIMIASQHVEDFTAPVKVMAPKPE